MAHLLDTCILLRAFERDAAEHRIIIQAIRFLWEREEPLYVTVQNIAEFWNVATRPVDRNGLGLSPETVARRVCVIERFATVIAESHESYSCWKELVAKHAVSGVKVHDARLVSVMRAHSISSILTLNVNDFARYPAISVVNPQDIAPA